MYQVLLNNNSIFNPEREDMAIADTKLVMELNKVDSFEFTVYPSHYYYESFQELTSIITIEKDNQKLFVGRIVSIEIGWEKQKMIVCEGLLGYLNDFIARPIPETTFTASQLFSRLLGFQTKFTVGTCDFSDEVTIEIADYQSVWEALSEQCIEALGGYLFVRESGNTLYLDWLDSIDTTSNQSINFGKNLLDLKMKKNGDDIFTCIIPLGAEDDDGNKLTLGDYPNDAIEDSALVALYGKIYKTVEFPEVDDVLVLSTKATEYLAAMDRLFTTIELTALDLSCIDADFDAFVLGEKVSVSSSQHGLSGVFAVSKIETDLLNPNNNKISLGDIVSSLTMTEIKKMSIEKTLTKKISVDVPLGMFTDEAGSETIREDFAVNITGGKTDDNGVVTEIPAFSIVSGDTALLEMTEALDTIDNKRKRVLKNSANNLIIAKDRVWIKNAVADGMSAKSCNLYGNFKADIFINSGLILQPSGRSIQRKGNLQVQDDSMAYDWCIWAKDNSVPFDNLILCEISNESTIEYCLFHSDVSLSGKTYSDWGTFSVDCYVYFYDQYGNYLYAIRSKSYTYTYYTQEQNTWIFGWDWFGTHEVAHTGRLSQGALYGNKTWGGIGTDNASKDISSGDLSLEGVAPVQSVDPNDYTLKSNISDYGEIRDGTYDTGGVTATCFNTSGGQSVYLQVYYGSTYSVIMPALPQVADLSVLSTGELYKSGSSVLVK